MSSNTAISTVNMLNCPSACINSDDIQQINSNGNKWQVRATIEIASVRLAFYYHRAPVQHILISKCVRRACSFRIRVNFFLFEYFFCEFGWCGNKSIVIWTELKLGIKLIQRLSMRKINIKISFLQLETKILMLMNWPKIFWIVHGWCFAVSVSFCGFFSFVRWHERFDVTNIYVHIFMCEEMPHSQHNMSFKSAEKIMLFLFIRIRQKSVKQLNVACLQLNEMFPLPLPQLLQSQSKKLPLFR